VRAAESDLALGYIHGGFSHQLHVSDRAWAEWIAYVLAEEGFEVIIQAWDFRPGSNFVLEMQCCASPSDA
jgi:hypothetical protein